MKPLTQNERQEIRNVLRTEHDAAISKLNAADPGWQKRIEDRKNKVAIGRLKVEKDILELQRLEDLIRGLEEEKAAVETRIRKKMPLSKREDGRHGCPRPKDLCTAISEIMEEVADVEMSKDATGKKAMAAKLEFNRKVELLLTCSTRDDVVRLGIISQ